MLEGISHAHDNLIVHRDVKPSNILVRKDGQAKLLDFGIATLLDEEGYPGNASLAVDGCGAMTPDYAAPEQLKGERATAATDVYALGVLLYVLLTGQHPSGPGPQTPAERIKAILEAEPVRPSDVVAPNRRNAELANGNAARRATTPAKLRRMLRGDLDIILSMAMKKNPQERYASARALADDLRRYI